MKALVKVRSEECEAATEYRLVGADEGIDIDQLGNIRIDTTKSITETGVQVYAVVLGNSIRIAQFSVEVYDCSTSEATFPTLNATFRSQVDEPMQ